VSSTSRFPGSEDGVIPESYAHFVDPFVALARASGVTKTIKLGTGIVLVPERHPLLLAKEIATLDLFSGGRFLFGIGAGWLREETQIMGGDFDHRWTQTRESILAMKELWTKPAAEFHGKYYDFPPVKSFPKPAQKPHPPVLLGGGATNVLQRVVAWGDGWLPNRITPDKLREPRRARPDREGRRARSVDDHHLGPRSARRPRSSPPFPRRGRRPRHRATAGRQDRGRDGHGDDADRRRDSALVGGSERQPDDLVDRRGLLQAGDRRHQTIVLIRRDR
jgi:probable F420-dependent oxidoreductase